MNKAQIEEWIRNPYGVIDRITTEDFKALCALALRNMKAGFSVPQGEPVAKVQVNKTGGNAGLKWSAVPINSYDSLPILPDGTLLYAAPPTDGVVVPRELEGEMLFEMWRAVNGQGKAHHDHESLKYVWRRTLAAAPKGKP